MSDKPKNLSDIDSFWDLNSLMPQKPKQYPSPRHVNTDTVELTVGASAPRQSGTPIPPRDETTPTRITSPRNEARRLNELTMAERAREYRSKPLDPYLIYTPDSRIIKRVEVSKWDSRFNFYESFRRDAKKLWSRAAEPCPHVPFFTYVPQYTQLKYPQLKWYLWWRENLRGGAYLETDFCYILLYIYEILNCPDMISPEEGLSLLCDVWLNYRENQRRLDSYLAEWLCDYCLINKLPCPKERLAPIMGDVISVATFKEFYMDGDSAQSTGAALLSHTSTYDWQKSRYVTDENRALFETHIRGAFDKVYREVLAENDGGLAKELRCERVSYEGALCVYNIKRTIAVEYLSMTRSPRFRFVVTDIIKYSENRVRMALGIRSRLKADSLTDKIKACIDAYFDRHLPVPKKQTARGDAPHANEYDKLYEPVKSSLSLENALKIEARSWDTTEKLTSAFDEEVPAQTPMEAPVIEDVPEAEDEFEALVNSLDGICRRALTILASGDEGGIVIAAKEAGMLTDALADKINEAAFDIIGDTIIEPSDNGYRLIEDYEGEMEKWLK